MEQSMWDVFRKMLKMDNTETSFSAFAAKLTAAWTVLFAGVSLGDIATLAAITWTVLNIIFLLYDRLIKKTTVVVKSEEEKE